jgi:diguanylate cyclase (GGDEF)-like protein
MKRAPGGWRLFAAYAAISLAAIAGMGFTLAQIANREVDKRAMASASSTANAIADGAIEPNLGDHPLTGQLSVTERRTLGEATSALRRSGHVLRLRIRTLTGTVIFDMAHPDAAPLVSKDDEVENAAKGRPVKTLTHLGADAVDGSSPKGPAAVEIYQPLHGRENGRVVGVLELYLPYAPFHAEALSTQHNLTMALVLGLGLLWVALGAITWSATRRLRRGAIAATHAAHHDSLTQLPNRLSFSESVTDAIEDGEPFVLAVANVDRLGSVNDALGHHNGDELLRHVGTKLSEGLARNEFVARLGGDEWGVLLRSPIDEAGGRLEALRRSAEADVELDGVPVSAGLTIGWATSPHDGATTDDLMRAAEQALRAARAQHRGIVQHSGDLRRFDPGAVALVAELRRALAEDELVLHYQPKISLGSDRVHSLEALIRWQHPTRGLLSPAEFLPIAESTGLIGDLTTWVLDRAAREIRRWNDQGLDLSVAVNVSPRSLGDSALPDQVLDVLANHAIAPKLLTVEITENGVMDDPARAAEVLARLHTAGVGVSLDDFGQGATSLTHLARLPLDELKIDRAFVVAMRTSMEDHHIVRSVVELGRQLNLTVVAEGVEDRESVEVLDSFGCHVVQGYLYARPMPPVALTEWLSDRDDRRAFTR